MALTDLLGLYKRVECCIRTRKLRIQKTNADITAKIAALFSIAFAALFSFVSAIAPRRREEFAIA